MKTAELRMIPVTELKPAEYNPRKKLKPGDKEYEKIKNSISGMPTASRRPSGNMTSPRAAPTIRPQSRSR